MTPAPSRTEIVRPVADDGIGDGVGDEGDGEGEADQRRVEADDLAVEQQKEDGEALILDAERDGAGAVGEARAEGRRALGGEDGGVRLGGVYGCSPFARPLAPRLRGDERTRTAYSP